MSIDTAIKNLEIQHRIALILKKRKKKVDLLG